MYFVEDHCCENIMKEMPNYHSNTAVLKELGTVTIHFSPRAVVT